MSDLLQTQPQFPNPGTQTTGNGSGATKLSQLKGTASYKNIIQDLESKYTSCRSNRLQFERQWYVNMAFYFGRQYVEWTSVSSGPVAKLYEPKAPPWRVRMIINQTRRYARKEVSRLTKEQPVGFVLPASIDEEDLMAAKAGDAIIEHLWRELKITREIRRAVFWSVLTGTGFLKDWYDPNEEESLGVMGCAHVERLSPFHILVPDVQEEELENQPFFIQEGTKHPEWVEQRYGKKVSPTTNYTSGTFETRFLEAMGIREQNVKELVHVKEMWLKPNSKYPMGLVVVWTGDEVLHFEEGWPYRFKSFPLSKIDYMPTGRFYGDSIINDLLPLQKELNRSRSQIIEARNRMSKPQLIAPLGSVDVNKMTSEPGLVIFYRPGFNPPAPVPLQNLPGYTSDEIQRIQTDMDDLTSQHEVSRGQTPSQVTAATAISYLQEQDDLVISPTISNIEEATEKIAKQLLHFVNQFWDLERQIRIVGQDGQFEAFAFSKANLAGNTDYVVQVGSGTPRSQAAKQAFIMELGKLGWIPPDRAMRYLQMAETGRLYEEMQVDSRQQQRENMKMALGVPVPVNSWDNDLVHIYELDNYRKKQSYESLDDQVKAIFEQHARTHKIVYIRKQYGLSLPETIDPLMLDAMIYGNIAAQLGGPGAALGLSPQATAAGEQVEEGEGQPAPSAPM